MIAVALAVLVTLAPGEVDALVPSGKEVARLRVAVTVDGRSPELAWGRFLNKLFDHFDRNGDGVLSPEEASRVFALPLPDGRDVKMDFARLDANHDGRGTRAEFREFYRRTGFAPVVAVVRPSRAEQRRLSDALFRHLDRDGDGALSRAELEAAPALLRRLDENEDEILTAAEVLALTPPEKPVGAATTLAIGVPTGPPGATLPLDLGKGVRTGKLVLASGGFEAIGATIRVPGGVATVAVAPADPTATFRTTRAFYLAQFMEALGDRAALTKADLESDAGLQSLVGMFDAADRDGDGKLTAAELSVFLELIELGVGCQVTVVVEDRGRDLFQLLDTNSDGTLDLGELTAAPRALQSPARADAVPLQVRFAATRGVTAKSFGPVPLASAPAGKPKPSAPEPRGPRWFQAMDRNGDGFVSPAEFLGPRELFRKLDADGDGRISADEAERVAASR